ncbi:ABC transporter ATP-binding protein [Bradyrhizobium sp. dw_78]|uniref:ABC transporter ATP-binding protein n=1 Tax=Bradyrhizobium sp. dw_78 TaxID=2719793 RepID=UPI001BD40FDA
MASSRYDLEVKSLSKSFGDTTVVTGVSFELVPGEFLALLGPSGCGKTTTLSMIAGFERPDSGHIVIRGKAVEDQPPERRNIGMVFQNYALFPHMSVAENIAFGLKMRRVSRSEIAPRVAGAAKLVKVDHLLDRQPRELSGGQQQRVALARALVVEPSLLLLDEPFGALDRQLREDLQVEVRALLRRLNITTVFVTHDQEEAMSMSDRIAVMKSGHIEQIASPRSLYEKPATTGVAAFIGRGSFISGQIDGADTTVIKTTIGAFRVPAQVTTALRPGDAEIFLRPEAIERLASTDARANRVQGKIIAKTFQGDRQLLGVAVGETQTFLVKVDASDSSDLGDEIWLGWKEEAAAVFQDDRRL